MIVWYVSSRTLYNKTCSTLLPMVRSFPKSEKQGGCTGNQPLHLYVPTFIKLYLLKETAYYYTIVFKNFHNFLMWSLSGFNIFQKRLFFVLFKFLSFFLSFFFFLLFFFVMVDPRSNVRLSLKLSKHFLIIVDQVSPSSLLWMKL